jgi:hypothetical protein
LADGAILYTKRYNPGIEILVLKKSGKLICPWENPEQMVVKVQEPLMNKDYTAYQWAVRRVRSG